MKKILLAFMAVLGLCFINYIPVHATSIAIPFSDVPALYYSFGTIAAGGSLNLEDYDNAEDFIHDLNALLRGQEISNNHYGLTGTTSKILFNKLASLALNGITELSEDGDLVITYSNTNTAQLMGYDKYYYKYLIASGEDVVVPQPDTDYLSVLNTINGTGFFWQDFDSYRDLGGGYTQDVLCYPYTSYSWFVYSNTSNLNFAYFTAPLYQVLATNVFDIYINSNNNLYSFDVSISPELPIGINAWNGQQWQSIRFDSSNNSLELLGVSTFNNYTYSYSGSLTECLNNIAGRFRNVNIYVDGVLWSLAGDITLPNPPILAPDIIGVGDLPDDTYGVLGLNEPVNLDLGAFLGWLQDLIDLDKDVISLGDLVDANDLPFLRTKDTDADIDLDDTNVIPAEQVIDDTAAKEEEDEETDPDPRDPDPPFPAPLPPILPIPDPNITPRQTTVLSEIIQATDIVVPSELMTLIWSTFGLLVVGGLIYILHK